MFETQPLQHLLADFKAGKPVIMVDDSDREDEGDIVIAAESIKAEHIAFMQKEARGLICVSLSSHRASELGLSLQVDQNNSPYQTAFTVSVDCLDSAAVGVEASARAQTILNLQDSTKGQADFVSPGHVFPLIADSRGVLGRRGQTEGSYDLARLAGCSPAAVICEILNPDGTMARGKELLAFAHKHNLPITSVEEVVRYRINKEILVRAIGSKPMMIAGNSWQVHLFEDDVDGKEHLALVYGDIATTKKAAVLTRIHSECLTGDVFASRRCDCGDQLSSSMKKIIAEGSGILLYLRQEGRGIGLANKLKAYALQDKGRDTVEANVELGFAPDERDFRVAAKILHHLDVNAVRLLTNNPRKLTTLEEAGIAIEKREALYPSADPYCSFYIETKKKKMGHIEG